MQLAIFNGSPRQKKSNSTLLIQQFLNGYYNYDHPDFIIHYLADTSKNAEHIEKFIEADTIIVIFPLYTDAMPGQVKYFLESIENFDSSRKNVGFIVQSGFPEAYHSTFVEKYLIKISEKMNWNYMGTIIKGGVEGIQIMPPSMTRKLYSDFEKLGRYFASTSKFDPVIIAKLRKPYHMSYFSLLFLKMGIKTGLANFYWNKKLKENNAYEKRSAQPYLPV
jgi:hypothetical protein